MPLVRRSALLPYSAWQVFRLVDDIESYPQYMDGCVAAEILRGEGDSVAARLELSQAGISQSFATLNRRRPPHRIELELLEGPFERFSGHWQFRALGEAACKLSLELDFSLRGPLSGAAGGGLLDSAASRLVGAIGERARQLYGRAGDGS